MNLQEAIEKGRFREDLYYRLNTVPIAVPALRDRREDIFLLFRKFASDVAVQYRMPPITLDDEARRMLEGYYWRGNIRQLKNVAEQISAIEENRVVTAAILSRYLPQQQGASTPVVTAAGVAGDSASERELLYKILFDMRGGTSTTSNAWSRSCCAAVRRRPRRSRRWRVTCPRRPGARRTAAIGEYAVNAEVVEEPHEALTKADVQREQIIRALRRNNGRRREAAAELFMSERTLYRKIKELGIEDD